MEHVVYEGKHMYLQDCYTYTFMIRTRRNQELFTVDYSLSFGWSQHVSTILSIIILFLGIINHIASVSADQILWLRVLQNTQLRVVSRATQKNLSTRHSIGNLTNRNPEKGVITKIEN